MSSNSEISFCVDCLIVETLLSNTQLQKTADATSLISSLIQKVKDYVGNHIDPDNKTDSFLNIIAPGAISVLFGGWLGTLFGLAMRVFNIDTAGILSSIYNKIKSALSGGKQLSSADVDTMVGGSVQEHNKPVTQEDIDRLPQQQLSVKQQLQDARMLKLAMTAYENELFGRTKTAGIMDIFSSRKNRTAILLGKVLGWVFKVALASAGLMVAGDVVNKFVGRPNALDNTIQKGKPVSDTSSHSAPTPTSTQTRFKLNPSYHEENYNAGDTNWIEKYSNTNSGIANMLVDFAKQVYLGLDNLDSTIKSLASFQVVLDQIAWNNRSFAGENVVFLPRMFHSKKQVVDFFIDELASKAPKTEA